MRTFAAGTAAVVGLLTAVSAQAQAPAPAQPPRDRFVPAEKRAPVPYEVWRGAMLFKMTVAGRPALALLDTGASISQIDLKFARDLNLPLEPDPAPLRTQSGGGVLLWRAKDVAVAVPGQFSLDASLLRVSDLSAISEHLARDIQFMFGQDFLRSLVLMVEPGLHEFQVAPTGALKALRGAQVLDLRPGTPQATISAGGRDISVIIDTGHNSDLCVSPAIWASLRPQVSDVRQQATIDAVGRVDDVRVGTLQEITLGEATVQNVEVCERNMTGFPADGLLGYRLLSRYRFALDMAAGKLWLSPREPDSRDR